MAQLERPGHLVLAGEAAVLFPVPAADDQGHGPPSPALGVVLVELLELDRLLDPARCPGSPLASGLQTLAQSPAGVDLDLRIEHRDEPVEVTLIESPDKLPNRVGDPHRALRRRGTSCTSSHCRTSRDRCGRLCRARL